jgi:hypothetical protein
MLRKPLPALAFLMCFTATLTWRLYAQNDCCPNNQFKNTYSSCGKHLAQQCGSANWCLVCNCAYYWRVTVPNKDSSGNVCPYAGAHDYGASTDATKFCLNNEPGSIINLGSCKGTCYWSLQELTQTGPVPQDNSCVHAGPPCNAIECCGACYSD